MIPEIGHFALILAMLLALVAGIVPMLGARLAIEGWMRVAAPAACGQFGFVAIAFGCLATSFLDDDFSVIYVVGNSNSALPAIYRFTAVWGGHEGSLLLWALLLTLWMSAVVCFGKRLPLPFAARVLGVMSWIDAGFLLFMLLTSNPFTRIMPPAMNGRDLNPLLQDPGMVIHPPLLYMGYVGFSVAFAFAIAALLDGKLDSAWARASRAWTLAAWMFLTLGIMLGSAWAYYELGWGGWWFWDPVENASFMPWLVGTALIHSLAATAKRGAFRAWSALLAICAFSLSLLGTFLVRSGVVTSVHGFASDPARGVFILALLALFSGGGLALFAWRAPRAVSAVGFEPVSREALLLSNNLLMLVAAASVMLGTLYPMVLDALDLDKISVGAPYFDSVFVPLMTPAIFLMGVGPLARWKAARLPQLAVRLRWAALVSVASAFVPGVSRPFVSLGLLLAAWTFATIATSVIERIIKGRQRARLATVGMWLAHAGVGVFVVGVTMVKGFPVERDARLAPGESVDAGGYRFRLDNVRAIDGPNYRATRATIAVTRDGKAIATLHPEKREFLASNTPATEAAIDRGVLRDLYVALDQPAGGGAWTVRIQIKPFVRWIWGGCVLMALGGLLAAADRRYAKLRAPQRAAAVAIAVEPPRSIGETGR
ncbi:MULTISPECIES: heme lyase CcmF/NrfE family subunit [unclassified Caballeronia]|uniref:heme lyase CcmF/NrfE family subunit n=1 Tax=unclassified Caballeronia TaxID=2646786 RepID=UPI0020292F25|nr:MULTISPECIES: heme lyase CcmF/NrfE family subunit [unclassified Caballeronia]MDR5790989.1 heme lyase CcmF/NrfE family subunit [Caballeronia sp. LP003]